MSFTSPSVVIERIERLVSELLISLGSGDTLPEISRLSVEEDEDEMSGVEQPQEKKRRLTKRSSKTFSSIFLILNYVHSLLSTKRTTTIREVYYL